MGAVFYMARSFVAQGLSHEPLQFLEFLSAPRPIVKYGYGGEYKSADCRNLICQHYCRKSIRLAACRKSRVHGGFSRSNHQQPLLGVA